MTAPIRVLLFIPAYRCETQIVRVIAQLDEGAQRALAGVVVVDNQSPDATIERATQALRERVTLVPWRVLRNDDNYGLGGSHKVAIDLALREGFTHVAVLHGDDQASLSDLLPLLTPSTLDGVDALLGARFQRGATLQGYSRVRTAGNHVYNLLFSAAGRRRFHDLGSGLNLFRAGAFAEQPHRKFADDLTFNYFLCLLMARKRWNIRFFPILWREEDQRSNVKLVDQGVRTLKFLGRYVRDPDAFLLAEHRTGQPSYTAQVVASGPDADR
ncbi:MAG: glycosyltransferase family 2 protein [Solirubrobacteraceae bacterium]|nr:glycosyltransferase family 2 protein [Solirubrobacteraceae bacterium]